MAECTVGKIVFVRSVDVDQNSMPNRAFGNIDCGQAITMEVVYRNEFGHSIRIDGEDPDTATSLPIIAPLGLGAEDIVQVSDFTRGEIIDGAEFSVFLTVDPGLNGFQTCQEWISEYARLQVAIPITSGGGSCYFHVHFTGYPKTKLPLVIDLGTQGNADGFMQMTTDVGSSISKGITITNPDCIERTYTIAQPAFWAGRFTSDFDLFTPFAIPALGSISANITYTPTVEEIECMTLDILDECEASFSCEICFEAVNDAAIVDPPDPDPGPGGGGIPPCEAYVDCTKMNLSDEMLIRELIVKDENGCPAIKIITT